MFLLTLAILCAPAPIPKPVKPVSVPLGAFVMTWKGTDAPTYFREGNFYSCFWQGRWWLGKWKQDGNALHVTEWPIDDPASVTKWTVRLSSSTSGTLEFDSPWKLVPQRGPVY